ncbi:cholecystokinin [Emydura macquarii macquarii]|uniref:cholecystokinin n=1 Tax=Emydura macquarii macquarii TaxID=1129001 RepID=UPI00352A50A3
MYSGICIYMFLVVLATSSFGQQATSSHNENPVATDLEQSLTEHHRHIRVPSSAGQLKPIPRVDRNVDQKANVGPLLAKYLQQARKGPLGRISIMGNKVQNIDPMHRINDRDYMGWMDFGRRSAEEYEYSS